MGTVSPLLAPSWFTAEPRITALVPGARLVAYGPVGDGNLHVNIAPAEGDRGEDLPARQAAINRITHDIVARYGGSISAEHGLGVLRRDEAARYKSPVEMGLMRALKTALDPDGLMNPGKLLA